MNKIFQIKNKSGSSKYFVAQNKQVAIELALSRKHAKSATNLIVKDFTEEYLNTQNLTLSELQGLVPGLLIKSISCNNLHWKTF